MKKFSIYLSMLMLAVLGLASCSEDYAMPPLYNPDAGDDTSYGTGSWDSPITVSQILGGTKVADAWFTGYIVGWIDTKGGTMNKFNEETATFTAPATLASNILMAASPDEKDYTKCIPVQLPSGDVRKALNLMDNPGNLGKLVTVKGSVDKYFGQEAALKSLTAYNWGDKGIEGSDKPNPPATGGDGNGSADAPYTVGQMLGGQTGNGVWVTGYIVGYIQSNPNGASSLTEEFAKFTADGAQASNLMLAASADEKNYANCTAINLPSGSDIRSALNLKDNPGNLGKQVSIKGDISKYFGVNGLRNPSAFAWGPKGGSGDTPNPPAEEGVIYSLLNSTEAGAADKWTFDNVNLPEGANYIWQWKSYNNAYYLNASAYVSGKNLPSEAYAISPVLDLSGYKTATASFEHAAKFQTTLRQLCGFAVRESGASEWTMIAIPTWPEAGAWTFAGSGTIDLSAYAGKKIEVAFKYGSTAAGADTWEIRNLKISGSK